MLVHLVRVEIRIPRRSRDFSNGEKLLEDIFFQRELTGRCDDLEASLAARRVLV